MISDEEIEREQQRAEEALERHRESITSEQNCGNCRFWKMYDDPEHIYEIPVGWCHRFPKVYTGESNTGHGQEFKPRNWSSPMQFSHDWCGEHQPTPVDQAGENP